MTTLEELMRRCREDGYSPTYQDLVELHTACAVPGSELISQLKIALSIEHNRLHDATKPIDENVLRAEFEARHSCSYGFKRSHRGTYTNPPTSARWTSFRLGAEVARGQR